MISKENLLNKIQMDFKETKRLKHIIELLASEVDISNEVFDVLSAENDYEWISSHAKK